MRTFALVVAAVFAAVFAGSACGARSPLREGANGEADREPDSGRKSAPTLPDSGANDRDAAIAAVAPFDCSLAVSPTTVRDDVGSFAIDGETVYASSGKGDRVFSFPRKGGPVTLIGADLYGANVITAARERIFVTDQAGSLWTEANGKPLEYVMRAAYASYRFAVDDFAAYGEVDDHIVALSLSDGSARTVGATNRRSGANPSFNVVLADDDRVLWSDPFGIGQISKSGGEPSVLVPQLAEGGEMVGIDGVLYVPTTASIVSVPEKTGAPVTRLDGLPGGNIGGIDYGTLAYLQASSSYLYWLTSAFAAFPMLRMPREGGAEEELTAPLLAGNLLLDDDCLYWVAWLDDEHGWVLQAMRLPE